MASKFSRPYQICTKTVMDTSDPDIKFDDEGICHHYHEFFRRKNVEVFDGKDGLQRARQIAGQIKAETRNREYDCIIGLSGGVDSSYVAHIVVNQLGLRPLAIHMDNGWNTELAVANIENIVRKLKIDLRTIVLDWEQYRQIQRAFFRASVGNVEMITDHAINATLFNTARRYGIRHIINGSNLYSEGILQSGGWGHDNKDYPNIRDINRRFGSGSLRKYPHLTPLSFAWSILIRKIRYLPILNYVEFDKNQAIKFLSEELGWRSYGRKHGESTFTRFFQEYYLPEKFNVDKRRSHLSSLICSGQITRDDALTELAKPLFVGSEKDEVVKFVCKKLGFNGDEWNEIMKSPPVPHTHFKTSRILSERTHWIYKYGRKLATGRTSG